MTQQDAGRQESSRPPGGRGQPIVVGVDGSPSSLRALRWAVRQAGLVDAPVEAVIAWQDPAVYSTGFEWAPVSFDGDVRAVWRMAKLALPPLPPLDLGELTATLVADGKRLAGPITNQGGDLDVRGDVSLGADRSAAVTLTLTPRRSDNTALSRLLSSIGTPVGNGWRISWQTPGR